MFDWLRVITQQWCEVKKAWVFFVGIVICSVALTGAGWHWYFKDRLDVKDQEIRRLSQALGIEKPENVRPLIGLTNTELKKKGLNVVQSIRSILSNHDNRNIELRSQLRKREVTEIRFQELLDNEEKRAKDELTAQTTEALMVHDELEMRVPGTARMQFGLPRIIPDDKRDARLSIDRAFSSTDAGIHIAPMLASNIEELAKTLPDR